MSSRVSSSRTNGNMERGRPVMRGGSSGSAGGADTTLSSFYRNRFGSHSPEEYRNLRLSHMNDALTKEEIKKILTEEFKHYEPFEVKIVRNPNDEERLAYVNFERSDAARKIRKTMISRLQRHLGRNVIVDPAGIIRDQEGKYIPDRYNRALQERGRSPPPQFKSSVRGGSLTGSDRGGGGGGGGGGVNGPIWKLKEDDTDATRTLFVGNLPEDIRHAELKRVFSRYGTVEEIDIKTPADTHAAYAFIMFQTMEQAMEAKHAEHERPLRANGPPCKIGYGKSQVSKRLWVGGLGDWTSTDELVKEFDRYGVIERVDYEDGAAFAYIRFKDTEAASDACRAMKGFSFAGKHTILVDFAKDSEGMPSRKRKASRSPSSDRTPPPQPPVSAAVVALPPIRNIDELDEEVASTWQGAITLKKIEMRTKLYRLAGNEILLQKQLRDEDGNPVRVSVTQKMSGQAQIPLKNKFFEASPRDLTVMLGIGRPEDALKPLVDYLCDKDAAGVCTLNSATLYAFAYGDICSELMLHYCRDIRLMRPLSPYVLFVLLRKDANSD